MTRNLLVSAGRSDADPTLADAVGVMLRGLRLQGAVTGGGLDAAV